MNEEQHTSCPYAGSAAQAENCPAAADHKNNINTHFTLALVAVIFSCASGFFSIAIALAALILSLRAQDLLKNNLPKEAAQMAYWSAFFSWLTIILALLPLLALIFFGGAILAALGAIMAAA